MLLALVLTLIGAVAAVSSPIYSPFRGDPVNVQTIASYQIVPNPLYLPEVDPLMAQAIWERVEEMNADRVRYCPWFPYPRLTVAQLSEPTAGSQCQDVHEQFNMTLSCDSGGRIDQIIFANFGKPLGSVCGEYEETACTFPGVLDQVMQLCLNQETCQIQVPNDLFPEGRPPTPVGCSMDTNPLHLVVQATCDSQQDFSHWDFTGPDRFNVPALQALEGRDAIINFSPQPRWLYNVTAFDLPDDPLAVVWNYDAGDASGGLIDDAVERLGEYHARYISYYTQGGFIDEFGQKITSPYAFSISFYEILNEIDFEHALSPELYTKYFDSVVRNVRETIDPDKQIKFVGLALGKHEETDYYTYFLNSSNHDPSVGAPDFISFHFYARPSNTSDPNTYIEMFTQAQNFVNEVKSISKLISSLSPTTQMAIDEVGIILGDDSQGFPAVAMNAGGATFAYLYLQIIPIPHVASFHQSQLVGFPPMLGLENQYPSVSMLDWTTGEGNPKWWILKLLREEIPVGSNGESSIWLIEDPTSANTNSNEDSLSLLTPSTTTASQPSIFVQWFQDASYSPPLIKAFLINTASVDSNFSHERLGGCFLRTVDEFSANQPAVNSTIPSGANQITLHRFAVAVVYWQSSMIQQAEVAME